MNKELINAEDKKLISKYVHNNSLRPTSDFGMIPIEQRLAFIQYTPKNVMGIRPVGGKRVPYVKIGYVERALNFVGNFRRGFKIIKEDFTEIKVPKKDDKGKYIFKDHIFVTDENGELVMKEVNRQDGIVETQEIYEAEVTLSCYIYLGEYREERDVKGTWKAYENKAVPKKEALKSAIANGIKMFARYYGIGADKRDIENQAISQVREEEIKDAWDVNFSNVNEE